MSIRKRLILSNIGMIIIPIVSFFIIEIILGAFLVKAFENIGPEDHQMFIQVRFVLFIIVIVVTNGLLTYFVSKSILKPIRKLTEAANKISEGDLSFEIKPMNNKDELGQLSETFESMRKRLKESKELQLKYEENRKELIANISHDLRTPITSIKGYVQGIQDGVANTPEKMNKYIQTIYTKAKDLDHLINELFLFSKLDANGVPFHYEKINLRTYLNDYIEELRFDLEKEGVDVSYKVNEVSSFLVKADREQLKRVLVNIIQNSVKHLDKVDKKIHVELTEDVEKVTVKIEDNGEGISADALPFIFDRFYREDQARSTTTGGSGLGLAIVKRIIEGHGGTIWADSKLGEGTTVYFTLKKLEDKDEGE